MGRNIFGGPLILLDQQRLPAWCGGPDEDEDTALQNDYERACAVNDYLGTIVVGDGHALILNDVPSQTTWWPLPATGGGILVRWHYAQNRETVSAALHGMRDVRWEDTGVRLSVGSSRCIMFDAALSGADVLTESTIVFGPYAGMTMSTYLDRPLSDIDRAPAAHAVVYAEWQYGYRPNAAPDPNCVIFDLAPCVYRIETAHFRPDDDTYLLLHRLMAT